MFVCGPPTWEDASVAGVTPCGDVAADFLFSFGDRCRADDLEVAEPPAMLGLRDALDRRQSNTEDHRTE